MSEIAVHINGKPVALAPAATVVDVLALMQSTGRRVAVELNGEIVPKSAHAATVLKPGDRLEIVMAVGGG